MSPSGASRGARPEKLPERALIKISGVASALDTRSCREMTEALIAGQRNPEILADLARGAMRRKRADMIQALTGNFEDHHGEIARMLPDETGALAGKIGQLTGRIAALLQEIPAAWGTGPDGTTGPGAGTGPGAAVLPAAARLDEIAGRGIYAAQAVIAGTGPDMTVFGSPHRLVSRARRCPATRQSGAKTSHAPPGKGHPCPGGIPGEIAASAARTGTFPGERCRRIARRRGKRQALAAIARSILVIICHRPAGPQARYHDLGPDHYDTHINRDRKIRSLIHQLQAIDADPGEVAALLTRQPPAARQHTTPQHQRRTTPPAAAACPQNPPFSGQWAQLGSNQ